MSWSRDAAMPQQQHRSNSQSQGLVRQQLATPRQHESVLIAPPWVELCDVVTANAKMLSSSDVDLNGVSLQALRQQIRAEVVSMAAVYTGALLGKEIVPPDSDRLIVTGHQPELFHSGVWAKNFAAAGLSRRTDGTALNLIIDNDTVASTQIKIPVKNQAGPTVEWIDFDVARSQQPWEEAHVLEPDLFRTFADRVLTRLRGSWGFEPLLGVAWPAAIDQMKTSARLCDCLAAARVAIERSCGLQNLEIPMSQVCNTAGFGYFVAYLLARLPKLHAVYNAAIREYREVHRMRSTTHPVPELDSSDNWLEIPFWIWRAGETRRRRPYARRIGSQLELRIGDEVLISLPLSDDGELHTSAAALSELGKKGFRLRTRALTTTLFSRLFLADIFIHGIGGAKYDAMTDQICENFLEASPPPFATISATVHLPLGVPYPVTQKDVNLKQSHIRDLRYNPDRYVTVPSSHPYTEEKSRILACLSDRRPSKGEHSRLASINAELYKQLQPLEQDLRNSFEKLKKQIQVNRVLSDREYAWCLQPAASVLPFFERQFLS